MKYIYGLLVTLFVSAPSFAQSIQSFDLNGGCAMGDGNYIELNESIPNVKGSVIYKSREDVLLTVKHLDKKLMLMVSSRMGSSSFTSRLPALNETESLELNSFSDGMNCFILIRPNTSEL